MAPRGWFLAAAAACAAAWTWSAVRLPERVPVHFGGGGAPDSWSSRTGALWTTAALGIGIALLFAGLAQLLRRLPADALNVPHPGYWKRPERVDRLRELLAEDMRWIGAATLLLLAAVQVLVVRAAGMADPRLDWWTVAVVVLHVGVVAGRVVWMSTRRYAVPRSAP